MKVSTSYILWENPMMPQAGDNLIHGATGVSLNRLAQRRLQFERMNNTARWSCYIFARGVELRRADTHRLVHETESLHWTISVFLGLLST